MGAFSGTFSGASGARGRRWIALLGRLAIGLPVLLLLARPGQGAEDAAPAHPGAAPVVAPAAPPGAAAEPRAAPAPGAPAAPEPPVMALYRPEFRPVAVLLEALSRLAVPGVRVVEFGPWHEEIHDGKPVPTAQRLLIEGPRERVEDLARALPRLDSPLPAVAVTVTVAEVRRRTERETGGFLDFDRNGVPGAADTIFRGTQGTFEPESYLRAQLTGVTPFQGTSLSLGAFEGAGQVFEHVLRALAQRQDAELLAQTTLVTGQGTPAELRSQVRIPSLLLISSVNPRSANPQVELQVRDVDAGLTLLLACPRVGPDGALLDLTVTFTSAEPNPEPDAPATDLMLRSRRLQTQVAARDGESVVLGGLTLTRNLGDRRSMPLIDQVPALDTLVSARGKHRETTELIFVLTPRLIVPPVLGTPVLVGRDAPQGAAGAVGETPAFPPGNVPPAGAPPVVVRRYLGVR